MEMRNGSLYRKKSTVPFLFSTEWLLASIFMLQILNGYLSELLSLWNIASITTIVYFGIVALSCFAYYKSLISRPFFAILSCLIAAGALILSCALDPAIFSHVFDFGSGSFSEIGNSELFIFWGLCFPTFLLCFLTVDMDILYGWLYKYSTVAAVMFILLMALHIFRFAVKLNYMSVAYNILLPFMVLYFASRERHDRRATFLWIGILAGILAGGCRGAVLTCVVLVALWEFKKLMPLNAKKFIGLMLFVLAAGVILMNFQDILLALDTFFAKQGYTSRLLEKYFGKSADGDLFHISDRVKLYNQIVSNFTITGYGVFADRLVLSGQYVHNFIFEIIYQFGYLFGVPVLALFVLLLGRVGLKAKRNRDEFGMFICFSFVVYMCTKMMVSASYITDRIFWIYLGFCLVLQRKNRGPISCRGYKNGEMRHEGMRHC